MKKPKNYKLILAITFIFIFINLYIVLYQGQIELPNKDWSKEIIIESVELPKHYNAIKNDDMELLKLNQFYYLLYYSENSFFLNQYNQNLDLVDSTQINKTITSVDDLNASIDLVNNIQINFLENTKLHSLTLDLDGKIIDHSIDGYNIQKVKYYENDILYSKYNSLYLNHKKLITMDEFIDLTFFKSDSSYYITYINHNPNTLKHELNTIKVDDNEIVNSKNINNFSFKTSTYVINLDSATVDKNFEVMVVLHDEKKNEFFNDTYSISNDLYVLNESRKNSEGFQFSYTGKSNSFIQKENSFIDIRDISTTNEKFPNIIMNTNGKKIDLTNTKRFPNKSKYYSFSNGDHLLFSQLNRNEILDIYVASTANSYIKKSQVLNFFDYINLFFSTLTTFIPLFIFGQAHSLLFLVPFFLIVVPFTFVKLNWAEWNPNKVLTFSIFLILISKTIYLIYFINPVSLPRFLYSTTNRLLIAYLLSGISIYSMIDRSRSIKNHYYTNFFIFFLIDIVSFTLFFSPYLLL